MVYKTQDHVVWVTRYRRKILMPGIAEYLKKVLRAVREFHPAWVLEEIGVERNHVHLHMVIPQKYAVSRVVETLKSVTSPQLKEKFPHVLGWRGVWAGGFFASTVGINEATIRQYVRHQGEQETGQEELEL